MTHPELPLYVWNEPGPHAKHPVAPVHAYIPGAQAPHAVAKVALA